MNTYSRLAVIFFCTVSLLGWAGRPAAATESDFSFKVHNSTDQTIKELLVSEDGETFGEFDIGSGIAPGKTVTLVWDKATDTEDCTQWFKAVFEDDSESKAAKFNFCEEDLTLEF